MIKTHILTSSIIATLLATNGVVAWQYSKDTKNLSDQLETEKKHVLELKNDNYKLNSLIDKQEGKITDLQNYNKQLSKTINDKDKVINNKDKTINKQNESINSLKKQLKNNDARHNSP